MVTSQEGGQVRGGVEDPIVAVLLHTIFYKTPLEGKGGVFL